MKKTMAIMLLIAFGQLALCQDVRLRIGEIEFFGINGYDVSSIRASMSSVVGREISQTEVGQVKTAIAETVRKATGNQPTDVAIACCDARGLAIIYIGLPSHMVSTFRYKPSPRGSVQLPDQAVRLYEETMELNVEAVQKNSVEDRSKGYALSLYPPLRAKQLALREYALGHKKLLHRVVLRSANAKQREMAAHILGYARGSPTQINTLISASRDPNEGVRNNAVRALGVLSESGAAVKSIPADSFIDMLNSGTWTDRNKGSHLLEVLSKKRDLGLLRQLRIRALASLIEMARWRNRGHADDARMILGRVAGIAELELVKLVSAGDVEQIVSAAQRSR